MAFPVHPRRLLLSLFLSLSLLAALGLTLSAGAAGIDTSGLTLGEIKYVAEWAGLTNRAPILPEVLRG